MASAFSWPSSQQWTGNDGSWSSFIVRIGTPPQDFQIFPSTAGQETLVPLPLGCQDNNIPNCGTSRGALPFNNQPGVGYQSNESSSFVGLGEYSTEVETNLDPNNVPAQYGTDTIGLGASDGLFLPDQIVGGYAYNDFWIGSFGLGPKPSNFSSDANPVPSFLTSLVNNDKIPSLSYGYTAGAVYRNGGTFGNLVLGGYDSSRFEQSNVEFGMNDAFESEMPVAIQHISGTSIFTNETANLIPEGAIQSAIDTTQPYIWLPQSACDAFSAAFGLIYDENTELYIVNETTHNQLTNSNLNINFTVGPQVSGGPTQEIVIPYSAFDQQANYPFYSEATNYFPIKVASNSTQYTLGRVFLQEAYLVADYQRYNFTINQATFPSPLPSPNVMTITAPGNGGNSSTAPTPTPIPQHKSSSGVSGGAIAGIVIGVLAVALLAGLAWFFCIHRRRREHRKVAELEAAAIGVGEDRTGALSPRSYVSRGMSEMSGEGGKMELAQGGIVGRTASHRRLESSELAGKPAAHEVEGDIPQPHELADTSDREFGSRVGSPRTGISPIGEGVEEEDVIPTMDRPMVTEPERIGEEVEGHPRRAISP